MMRHFTWLLVGVLLAVGLSGCVKMQTHVTMYANGSADVEYVVGAESSFVNMMAAEGKGQNPFQKLKADFTKDGFKVSDYTEGKYAGVKAIKRVKNSQELLNALNTSAMQGQGERGDTSRNVFNKVGQGLQKKNALFTTTYALNTSIDLSTPAGQTTPDEATSNAMANSMMDMSFVLTLPVKPTRHNAPTVRDGGRTLEWPMKIGEKNDLQMEVTTVNTAAIGIGGGLLVLIILGVVLGITLKSRRPQAPAAPLAPPSGM